VGAVPVGLPEYEMQTTRNRIECNLTLTCTEVIEVEGSALVTVTHLVWPHQPENPPGRPRAQRIMKNGMTNYHIGPRRATSNHIGRKNSQTTHLWTFETTNIISKRTVNYHVVVVFTEFTDASMPPQTMLAW